MSARMDDLADLRIATDGLIAHVNERASAAAAFLRTYSDES